MSSPQQKFVDGKQLIANGGSMPYGATNFHFFAGAQAELERIERTGSTSPIKVFSGDSDWFDYVVSAILLLFLWIMWHGIDRTIFELSSAFSFGSQISQDVTPPVAVQNHVAIKADAITGNPDFDNRLSYFTSNPVELRRVKITTLARSCAGDSRTCRGAFALKRGAQVTMNVDDTLGEWVWVGFKDNNNQLRHGYVSRRALSTKVIAYGFE